MHEHHAHCRLIGPDLAPTFTQTVVGTFVPPESATGKEIEQQNRDNHSFEKFHSVAWRCFRRAPSPWQPNSCERLVSTLHRLSTSIFHLRSPPPNLRAVRYVLEAV